MATWADYELRIDNLLARELLWATLQWLASPPYGAC